MLLKLSDKISECLSHAADARERANAATDPSFSADYLATSRDLDLAAALTRAAGAIIALH
jgi:hypothetical protein